MSYYFGIFLADLVVLCADRGRVSYPQGVFTSDIPRCVIPFPNLVILPSGNLPFARHVMEHWALSGDQDGLFDIEKALVAKESFRDFCLIWYQVLKCDTPHENADILFAGSSPSGPYSRFIGCLSSENDFEMQVANKVGTFICLRQKPEILNPVVASIKNYIGGTAALALPGKKNFAKRLFPRLMAGVAAKDHRVSSCGDIIFIGDGNIEVHAF